ncbi:MAG: carboxymuconolactone decarboxylase family protein [Dehalococcoidales bacterium]|nr:carboxymuconolactone decarboxylase family protein [Dehalococcoidales bacterium]
MKKQIAYYEETAVYRDKFDSGLPAMAYFSKFRKEVYKDGALNLKVKRLIALAVGLQSGCTRCVIGQTKDAVKAGATKEEILEAVSVAVVMGGTAVSAETWRVVKTLEELGKW